MVVKNLKVTCSDGRGSGYASNVNFIRLNVYFFAEAVLK